jgi:plastocyanin
VGNLRASLDRVRRAIIDNNSESPLGGLSEMQFNGAKYFQGAVLVVSAAIVAACAGGDKSASGGAPADTTKAAAAPAAAAAAPAAAMAALPITGKTYEVKMIGDEKGYRFEPAALTIKVGDGLKFVNVIGGPHNIAFNTVPDASKGQLDANMPSQTGSGPGSKMGDLSGPLLVAPNDTYTVSFAGVTPGSYEFNCTPHLANNMKGSVTVQ